MESRSTSLIARKRKQPPSSSITTPLFSSFNRSKSWRSDIAFTSSAGDEDSSRHTVKLLCSRRVFSPDPWVSGEELRNSIPDSSCEPRQIVKKQSESTCNQVSSGFNYDADNCSTRMLNPVDDGENLQTTPPEAIVGSVGAAANASQVADSTIPVEPAAKYKQGRFNPQFRGRLVKSLVSFSYRRLLPYLMDIEKEVDDSGATTTGACKEQQKTQGGTIPIQKAPEDVICNGVSPTAKDCSKEVAAIIGHANGGSSSPSNESPRDLSPPVVINLNCGNECKRQDSKDGEDDGKIDHSSDDVKAPAENKPVEEDIQVLHPLNNNVEEKEMSKPCRREEETRGTKEVLVLNQNDNSDVSGGVSIAQGNNRLLQSSILHNKNVDFVTSSGIMKSNDKSPPPKNKKVLLNPCSRLKLSKSTNNSFSYKRLLPYLMEIATDNSGAASESPSPTEEVQKMQQQHSPPHQFEEEQVALRMSPPSTIMKSSSDSILLKDDNNASPASSSTSVETPLVLVLEAAVSTTSTTTTSTRSPDDKLEPPPYEKEKKVDLISPVVEQALIGRSSVTTEVDRLIVVQEEEESPPKREKECIRVCQVGSTRGILKRNNPRGCRGLCTCLSCSSFRLNAERAFEFSRNQMKDTEEVAFALMKEVSHLRSVLQKLKSTPCQVLSNDQVEEACVRASQIEKAAKDRLCLMNEDLNIHCRVKCLHPPSVTFNEP